MTLIQFFSDEKSQIIRVLKEAIVIGLAAVLMGYIASKLVRPYFKIDLPEICKNWNKKHVMEWSLFMTGFLLHIFFEISGANKSYADYRSKLA